MKRANPRSWTVAALACLAALPLMSSQDPDLYRDHGPVALPQAGSHDRAAPSRDRRDLRSEDADPGDPAFRPDGAGDAALAGAFADAAARFDVPVDLLLALSYAENRWNDHGGQPSIDNGYGLMHLVDNPQARTLAAAAELLGTDVETLKTDRAANVLGGAVLLARLADELGIPASERADVSAWYPAVARYSNAADPAVAAEYADEVYRVLARGVSGLAATGETLLVTGREVAPRKGPYEGLRRAAAPDYQPGDEGGRSPLSADYAPALWTAASSSNYRVASRPTDYAIDRVVIHDTEGSYSGTISWFQNPAAKVSAHYVLRSSDGQITQMVREKDVAWHVSCWNNRSIGLEHEGYASQQGWYTDPMYRASAALVRSICARYGIPKDRTHIVGHGDVASATGCTSHYDPGPYWDWTYFMSLVNQTSTAWSQIVDNATPGRFSASGSWGVSSYTSTRYGSDYRYASPQAVSDAAWFKVNVPSTGSYEVFAWWPSNSAYSSSVPFVVSTTGGMRYVYRDQRVNGGRWNSLGTFTLAAGDQYAVGVSRWTSAPGYVMADAVKVVRR